MLTVAYRGDKTYKVLYENVSEVKSKINKTTVSILMWACWVALNYRYILTVFMRESKLPRWTGTVRFQFKFNQHR